MSHFCCTPGRHHVVKAIRRKRPRWRDTRSPERLESLHNAMSRAVKVSLVSGIETFKKKINPEMVYNAWLNQDYDKLYTQIPWNDIHEDVADAHDVLADGLAKASDIGMTHLDKPEKNALRYDYKNPRIQNIFQNRVAEWNNRLGQENKENIQAIIHSQFTDALSPRRMATELKNHIGLSPRYSKAQLNFVRGLQGQGLSEERITQLSEANYDRLLDSRAKTIARTESQFMINHGQLAVWQEGLNQGLILPTATKVWVVDGNPCPDCEDMDGEEVPVNDVWMTVNGPCEVPSDIHPNCECLMTLNN